MFSKQIRRETKRRFRKTKRRFASSKTPFYFSKTAFYFNKIQIGHFQSVNRHISNGKNYNHCIIIIA